MFAATGALHAQLRTTTPFSTFAGAAHFWQV